MTTYHRSSAGLQARVVKFTFPAVNLASYNNYCPFFWLSLVALILAPVAVIMRSAEWMIDKALAAIAIPARLAAKAVPTVGNSRIAQRIYHSAEDKYNTTRWWNAERVAKICTTRSGRQWISDIYDHHYNYHKWLTKEELIAWVTPFREDFENDIRATHGYIFDTDSMTDVLSRHYYQLRWQNHDNEFVNEYYSWVFKRTLLLLSPAALFMILQIGSTAGWVNLAILVTGIAFLVGMAIAVVWAIPYAIAAYKKLCPELVWDNKQK